MKKKRNQKRRRRGRRHINFRNLFLVLFVGIVIGGGISSIFEPKIVPPEPASMQNHTYDWTKLRTDNGQYAYEDDSYRSMYGIDVSDHQKKIDWQRVKQSGVQFAFIRVGYRGYETGEIHEDAMFRYNIEQAKKNGILVGAYFFSQATNTEEAKEEADYMIRHLFGYELDLPVVYDFEETVDGTGRADGQDPKINTDNAITFAETVERGGYRPMIYNSASLYQNLFITENLEAYPFWVAHYDTTQPDYPYTFSVWQYSSTGNVDGIVGGTDLDILFVPKKNLEKAN